MKILLFLLVSLITFSLQRDYCSERNYNRDTEICCANSTGSTRICKSTQKCGYERLGVVTYKILCEEKGSR